MTLKGKVFTADDLAPAKRQRMGEAAVQAWAQANTDRYRIVARDPQTGEDIIAEELEQRALNRLSPRARRAAGALAAMDHALRREVLSAFDADGSVRNPFEKA